MCSERHHRRRWRRRRSTLPRLRRRHPKSRSSCSASDSSRWCRMWSRTWRARSRACCSRWATASCSPCLRSRRPSTPRSRRPSRCSASSNSSRSHSHRRRSSSSGSSSRSSSSRSSAARRQPLARQTSGMTSGVELTTDGARDHVRQTGGAGDHARARPQGLRHTHKARGTQAERGANGAHGITVIGGGCDKSCRWLCR